MSLYNIYETDTKLENEGVWVSISKDIKVKVAALGNKAHQEILEKLLKPYKSQIRKNLLDKELEEDIHVQAIAKTILIDWEGMTDRDGKPLPYSYENAYKLLTDEKLKRFKGDILYLAKEAETFKTEEKEEAVKNSEKSSAGKSSTGTKS